MCAGSLGGRRIVWLCRPPMCCGFVFRHRDEVVVEANVWGARVHGSVRAIRSVWKDQQQRLDVSGGR